MNRSINHLGQPIGFAVAHWTPRCQPPRITMEGHFCRVVPLDMERHAANLYQAFSEDMEGRMWTYLASGPFANLQDCHADAHVAQGRLVFSRNSRHEDGSAIGLSSYLRVEPEAGSIEVGALIYSPRLHRTSAGTEAMYLMMRRVSEELGYHRYEWKCNALNEASMRAAKRLGFSVPRYLPAGRCREGAQP